MPTDLSHRSSILLPPDLRRRVHYYQADRGLSFGAVVREALEVLLASEAPPAAPSRSAKGGAR